jgi:hypothetical protein
MMVSNVPKEDVNPKNSVIRTGIRVRHLPVVVKNLQSYNSFTVAEKFEFFPQWVSVKAGNSHR